MTKARLILAAMVTALAICQVAEPTQATDTKQECPAPEPWYPEDGPTETGSTGTH